MRMLLLSVAAAATLTVPDQYATLASACTSAATGDEIVVSAYALEDIYCDVSGKELTIRGATSGVKVDPIYASDGSVWLEDVVIASQGGGGSIVANPSAVIANRVSLTYEGAHGIVLTDGSTLDSEQGLVINGIGGTSVGLLVTASGTQETRVSVTGGRFSSNRNSAVVLVGGGELLDFTCTDCTFAGNGWGYPANGGGIDTSGAAVSLTLGGGAFTDNISTATGGAVNTTGDLTLTGVTFSGNSSGDGSAVWHKSGSLDVTSTSFLDNRAHGLSGGALISTEPQSFSVHASTFTGNQTSAAVPGTSALVGKDLPGGATVQWSRFCDNGPSFAPTSEFASTVALTGSGNLVFIRNVVDQNKGLDQAAGVVLGGAGVKNVEHNTFAGNDDRRATLAIGAGTLRFVNNFVDSNAAGLVLAAGATVEAENNAFREQDNPGDNGNFDITNPDYLDYAVGGGCEVYPYIGDGSELINRGSENTIAGYIDDQGLPDVGAAYVDGELPEDTDDPTDTDTDTDAVVDSGPAFVPGGSTGGCSHSPAAGLLGLLLLVRRRR
jgi:hypothetical protein